MKIRLHNSSAVCDANAGESILSACARAGIVLPAACGGQGRCGKCKVRILEGQVSGNAPDSEGRVKACSASPVSDITIVRCENDVPIINEVPLTAEDRPVFQGKRAGAAIDIGTTTVCASLIDMGTAAVIDTVSELNDQRVFGADVMSRINAAKNGRTKELFSLINRQTRRILLSFLERCPKIEKLSVSGNTVMLHLFLNIDPSGMGAAPFTPAFLDEKELPGNALSLPVETISVLPSVSAFIGGDIAAGLAVIDIANNAGPSLYVDIGTNGEMALVNGETIFCCSTAAGPAFEGAEISCGTGGIKGAINTVELAGGAVSITTIANAPPVGVCGAGLIDAVAVMLKKRIIDKTGFMAGPFYLAPGISITGRDIRQFQLAKSAILSGVRILCKKAGLQPPDIARVFIAGGFGFFINKQNAVSAGILPKEFLDLISVCGNLSLKGAEANLTDKNFLARCKKIISRCSVIDLSSDPSFMDEFAGNMHFE